MKTGSLQSLSQSLLSKIANLNQSGGTDFHLHQGDILKVEMNTKSDIPVCAHTAPKNRYPYFGGENMASAAR